jgi:transposase, IS30 family
LTTNWWSSWPGEAASRLPKGTDLAAVTQDELDAVAAELNGRPRQTLGWLSPSEKFAEAVALTG